MEQINEIIDLITHKRLPLSPEHLRKTVEFCQQQIQGKNFRVLSDQLPKTLWEDWVDESLSGDVRAHGHFHASPADWRAAMEEQCDLVLTACLEDSRLVSDITDIAGMVIWRAGWAFIPSAVRYGLRVCHIQMKRGQDLRITMPLPLGEEDKIILQKSKVVLVLDPMIAAGTSCDTAINVFHFLGIPHERIIFLCICAAPEGICRLLYLYPGIRIIAGSLSHHLNEDAYIVGPSLGDGPGLGNGSGLGDAGERYSRGNRPAHFRKYRGVFNNKQWGLLKCLLKVANIK